MGLASSSLSSAADESDGVGTLLLRVRIGWVRLVVVDFFFAAFKVAFAGMLAF